MPDSLQHVCLSFVTFIVSEFDANPNPFQGPSTPSTWSTGQQISHTRTRQLMSTPSSTTPCKPSITSLSMFILAKMRPPQLLTIRVHGHSHNLRLQLRRPHRPLSLKHNLQARPRPSLNNGPNRIRLNTPTHPQRSRHRLPSIRTLDPGRGPRPEQPLQPRSGGSGTRQGMGFAVQCLRWFRHVRSPLCCSAASW